jgi:soluble lytic murein transglycosylase-like protein
MGAQGLMQLMPQTSRDFNVADPFDPKENINAGAALLKKLLDKYNGDLKLALAAYNAGANTIDPTGTLPDIDETKNYVAAIIDDLNQSSKSPGNQLRKAPTNN